MQHFTTRRTLLALLAAFATLPLGAQTDTSAHASTEWWHFDYNGWREYPVLNTPFERIR